MKKIFKSLISLALLLSYSTTMVSATNWTLDQWMYSSGTAGNVTSNSVNINSNSKTNIIKMSNMDTLTSKGYINYGGAGKANLYALIDKGGSTGTVWKHGIEAPNVNFAAFDKNGFMISKGATINAASLMLTTQPLDIDAYKNNYYKFDNSQANIDGKSINIMGDIDADAVILNSKLITVNPEAQVNGKAIKMAAGDKVTLDMGDGLGFRYDSDGAYDIAKELAKGTVTMTTVGAGLIQNQGLIKASGGTTGTTGIELVASKINNNWADSLTGEGVPTSGLPANYKVYSQIATNDGSNIKITAGDLYNNAIISTAGELKRTSTGTAYELSKAAGDVKLNLTKNPWANHGWTSSYSDLEGNAIAAAPSGSLKMRQRPDDYDSATPIEGNCGVIKTKGLDIKVDGDIEIGPGVTPEGPITVVTPGTITVTDPLDTDGDIDFTAGKDIINDTTIKTDGSLDWDAGRDIINNGLIDVNPNGDSNNPNTVDLDAERYIVNNGKMDLEPQGDVNFDAGKSIITTDPTSREELAADGVQVRDMGIPNIRDEHGNAITNIAPVDGDINWDAGLDIINNGVTQMSTNPSKDPNKTNDIKLKAKRHFIQNNKLDALAGNDLEITAVDGYIITTDPDSRQKLHDSGIKPGGGFFTDDEAIRYVSDDVANNDPNGNALTNLFGQDSVTLKTEALDIINNGVTKIAAPTVTVDAKRHLIQDNILKIGPSDQLGLGSDFKINGKSVPQINANNIELRARDGYLITTDKDSRAKLLAAGIDGSSLDGVGVDGFKFVSQDVKNGQDANGNAITDLYGKSSVKMLADSKDIINNGITTIAAPTVELEAGRHLIQSNILDIGTHAGITSKDIGLKANAGYTIFTDKDSRAQLLADGVSGSNLDGVKVDGFKFVSQDVKNGQDANGNAITKLNGTQNVNIGSTNLDVINNGATTITTPNALVSAGRHVIQNNRLTIKDATNAKFVAGNIDNSGKIFTTDATSRAAFTTPYVSKDVKGLESNGRSITTVNNSTDNVTRLTFANAPGKSTEFVHNGDMVVNAANAELYAEDNTAMKINGGIKATHATSKLSLISEKKDIVANGAEITGYDIYVTTPADINLTNTKITATNILDTDSDALAFDTATKLHGKNTTIKTNKDINLKNYVGNVTADENLKLTSRQGKIFASAGDDDVLLKAGKSITLQAATEVTNEGTITVQSEMTDVIAPKITTTNGAWDGTGGTLRMTATGADGQTHKDSTIKAENIFLKAEAGNIALDGTNPDAKNMMSTRSNTISFANGSTIHGDKTTISTIQDINVNSMLDKVIGDSELTMHSDHDVIVSGNALLTSANKATLAAGNNIILNDNVTYNTKEGYMFAGNKIDTTKNVTFNGAGNIAANTINVNGSTIKALNGDLKVNSTGNQTYTNATLSASKNMGFATGSTVKLNEDANYGYISGFDASGTPVGLTGTLSMAGSTATAGGTMTALANDIVVDNSKVTANSNVNVLANRNITLNGGNTVIKSNNANVVLKADANHYIAATGGVITNNTGKQMAGVLQASNGKWMTYSNETQALKDDATRYMYDQKNPNFVPDRTETIVFYGVGLNETGGDIVDPVNYLFNDTNIQQSQKNLPEELRVWKRFVNHVDDTKAQVNQAVDRYVGTGANDEDYLQY